MGHERLGILPRRQNWSSIIEDIRKALVGSNDATASLVANTLHEVRNRYKKIYLDSGVQSAFAFLVAISTQNKPLTGELTSIDLQLESNPSIFSITAKLNKWVEIHSQSKEYAELATRAAADSIASWYKKTSSQTDLFSNNESANLVWGGINGGDFSDISRIFFTKLTERYVKYFIDRGASEVTSSLNERMNLDSAISDHIDKISRHAFETSKITQSFSAGWYNKYAENNRPTDTQIFNFLAHSFSKLKEELSREVN